MKSGKIFIAGINGMVGSAIKNELIRLGYSKDNIIGKSSKELDLRDYALTKRYLSFEKPDTVIISAAKVGGIMANINNPITFLQDNLEIQTSLIKSCHEADINNVIFLSSSCVYPREAPQPMKEEYLLTGKLEPTNEGYAIAKLSGMKLIEAYRNQHKRNYTSLIPCNIYGINDDFDPENSHVVAALIRKFIYAKENDLDSVSIWGTGNAMRELMFTQDLANAVVHFIENPSPYPYVNVGTGRDLPIRELASQISEIVGYKGLVEFDKSKPDGMPRKVLDISRLTSLGWTSKFSLVDGLSKTIQWYKEGNFN